MKKWGSEKLVTNIKTGLGKIPRNSPISAHIVYVITRLGVCLPLIA